MYVHLPSHNGGPCKLRLGERMQEFPAQPAKPYTLDGALR